jgi:hypothetical protein
MQFNQVAKLTEKFVTDNSPTILTGIGVAGVVATAFLTGKASIKAHQILEEEALKVALSGDRSIRREDLEDCRELLTPKEQVNLVWREFVPPVLMGAATIAAIIGANQIGTRRTAALAAAYTLSEKASNEFREKVKERLGSQKVQEIKDEIAQERVNKDHGAEIVIIGDGKVKCLEMYTGRYFMIRSVEDLKAAQNKINYDINNNMYASLSDFYDYLDIPHTSYSDEVGWKNNELLEISIGGALDEDNRPVVSFDYVVAPVRNYFRLG